MSVLALGLFHEWTSCIASVILTIYLFFNLAKCKKVCLSINSTLFSVALLVFMYAASVFWAIDKGMAFIGFLKFLPVLLFYICLLLNENTEALIKKFFPFFMAATVFVCTILTNISATKNYFSVAGRFAGTFQYPNSFAIVILIAELLTFNANIKKYLKLILIAILIFGLFYTGSRTVILIAVVSNICMILYKIKLSKKTAIIYSIAFITVLGTALTLAFAGVSPFSRILMINFGASTFAGRLLYFRDALPVILKHPFGLGYLGYFYSQTAFQTGIYSVKYVHNDILQIALDIGIIPSALFVWAIIKSVFSKHTAVENRIIVFSVFLHILFDFDLQFVAVFMLLLVFMKHDGGKTIALNKSTLLSTATVLSVISLYFSVALCLSSFGAVKASNSMYPYNTDNEIKALKTLNQTGEFEKIADNIINRNEYVYYAYSQKAKALYTKGDFAGLIKYKNLVFDYAPLAYEEYEEYCYMLINGITLYNNAGDTNSARICKKQLISTRNRYIDNIKKISYFGYKIKAKPKKDFSNDIVTYIQNIVEQGV